jgi:hypothetical protein
MKYIPLIQSGGIYENFKDRDRYILLELNGKGENQISRIYEEGCSLNRLAHLIVKNTQKRKAVLEGKLKWKLDRKIKKRVLEEMSQVEDIKIEKLATVHPLDYLKFRRKIKRGLNNKKPSKSKLFDSYSSQSVID